MADYFAILHQPRLPALDPEIIKQEFLRLSTEVHPDKVTAAHKGEAEKRFAEVNAAYHTLRHTRARLVHLLEIEGVPPAPHIQSSPPEVVEFFAPIAEITREVDSFLGRKRKASSPILQAGMFEEALGWTDKIQALQLRLHHRISALEGELPLLNAAWEKAPGGSEAARLSFLPIPRLQQIAAALGFLERWHAQLQERLTTLAC